MKRPSRTARRALWITATGAALLCAAAEARAGSFDSDGSYLRDPSAVAFQGFEAEPERYLPDGVDPSCSEPMFLQVAAEDALEGGSYLTVNVNESCSERFVVHLPKNNASYRASVWMRHGAVDAQLTILYGASSPRGASRIKLFPTGQYTNDGWVELESNEFPVDGADVEVAYLLVTDYADREGVDLDALELVAAGEHVSERPCRGVGDPVCTSEEICLYHRCRLGRMSVPPLPPEAWRDDAVDILQSRMRVFFGGRKTRLEDLPAALAVLESIRSAETAWAFWNGWARAMRRLHDWHTRAGSSFRGSYSGTRRLNVCFIEGDGDASAHIWPQDPRYRDLLVSHTGSDGTHGLAQGDRLVAVDGHHPIAWALSLAEEDWGWWQACDSEVFTEFAERMRGLILAYATEFTVVHCDQGTGTCDPVPRTYVVTELPEESGSHVSCDNRPFYHFVGDDNPGPDHRVGWSFFRGQIAGTDPAEAIYGMVWDTLYGGGDPTGWVNTNISEAIDDWKANARGVILDHRAGSGGTLDAVDNLARLVRPPEVIAIDFSPIQQSGFDGPATPAEGVALFQHHEAEWGWEVGAIDHDPVLPVALILHRDGSASDYMPFALKGSPKVRLFASQPTAGAFSTYLSFNYWGGISWQLASGEPISSDGRPLIGHGVQPDEVVVLRQSDVLAGIDTVHEAALAWVRQELKP